MASDNDDTIPGITSLIGNYPNPFNSEYNIAFLLAETSNVSLTIYNARGQKVRTLVNSELNSGNHSVIWNGKDNQGKSVTSEVYYYKMDSGKYTSSKKMILIK